MNLRDLALVLVYAKQRNHWVSLSLLAKYGLTLPQVMLLEDRGYVITMRTSSELLIKATRTGYRYYNDVLSQNQDEIRRSNTTSHRPQKERDPQ